MKLMVAHPFSTFLAFCGLQDRILNNPHMNPHPELDAGNPLPQTLFP